MAIRLGGTFFSFIMILCQALTGVHASETASATATCSDPNALSLESDTFPSDGLVSLDQLKNGSYGLTEVSFYISEVGRLGTKGEARLVYELKTPGKLSSTDDYYIGDSGFNDSSQILVRPGIGLGVGLEIPLQLTVDGKAFKSDVSSLRNFSVEGTFLRSHSRQVVLQLSDIYDIPPSTAVDPSLSYFAQSLFVPDKKVFRHFEFSGVVYQGAIQASDDSITFFYENLDDGVMNMGFKLGYHFISKFTYSKAQKSPLLNSCSMKDSKIVTHPKPACGILGSPACSETRSFKALSASDANVYRWSLVSRSATNEEVWRDETTQLLWSNPSQDEMPDFSTQFNNEQQNEDGTFFIKPKYCNNPIHADLYPGLSARTWEFPTLEDFQIAHDHGLYGIVYFTLNYGADTLGGALTVKTVTLPNGLKIGQESRAAYCDGNDDVHTVIHPCNETEDLEARKASQVVCVSRP